MKFNRYVVLVIGFVIFCADGPLIAMQKQKDLPAKKVVNPDELEHEYKEAYGKFKEQASKDGRFVELKAAYDEFSDVYRKIFKIFPLIFFKTEQERKEFAGGMLDCFNKVENLYLSASLENEYNNAFEKFKKQANKTWRFAELKRARGNFMGVYNLAVHEFKKIAFEEEKKKKALEEFIRKHLWEAEKVYLNGFNRIREHHILNFRDIIRQLNQIKVEAENLDIAVDVQLLSNEYDRIKPLLWSLRRDYRIYSGLKKFSEFFSLGRNLANETREAIQSRIRIEDERMETERLPHEVRQGPFRLGG